MAASSWERAIPKHNPVGTWLTTAAVTAAVLVSAPAAFANTTNSTNWAGYAIHRPGLSFHSVQGTWTQPTLTCTPGIRAYSSYWVGLGGYSVNSSALEQIGTEADCTASGRSRSTAWYELVPAPSVQLRLVVRPGDLMRARVRVDGHRVVVSLYDVTRGHGFTKTVRVSPVDVSSAEWIVEAPSECLGAYECQSLPLANFGSTEFGSAIARTVRGHVGSISNPNWKMTKIKLVPGGRRLVSAITPDVTVGTAIPSALTAGGSAFEVTYSELTLPAGQLFARSSRSTPTTFLGSMLPR